MITSREQHDTELLNWFKVIYTDFLKDNKGYPNILNYIEGLYNGNRRYWARYARKAGLRVIRRGEDYFIKS